MSDEIILEIVTPEKMAFTGEVEDVTLPGTEGEFGVLRGHEAILSSVDIGELSFTKDGKKTFYAVNTGYAEVTADKVTLLIETAERSDTIDKDRAERAKARAESGLAQAEKESDEFNRLNVALMRALARIKVAEK